MKLFGWQIPVYRKGTIVSIAESVCARGSMAEELFSYLDPQCKFKRNLYGSLKRGTKGKIISLMKYKEPTGDSFIYYGVLVKDVLFAIEEGKLARA
jgi:hypothetical protein